MLCASLSDTSYKFEEAAACNRWEAEGLLQTKTARVATQTLSHMKADVQRVENNVAAEFYERQRICIHEFQSNQHKHSERNAKS